MNELLGWYGYEKVNSSDTEHLNLERYTSGDKDDPLSPSDDLSRDDSFDSGDDNASQNSEVLSKYSIQLNSTQLNHKTNISLWETNKN